MCGSAGLAGRVGMWLDSASMSSGDVVLWSVGVGEEGAVDAFGELPLESSEGFGAAVA
jgi:hypothetical protein